MIEAQFAQFIHDPTRQRSALFIAKDTNAAHAHQIPLIDAYVSAIDYLPACPFIVMPTTRKLRNGLLFKNTHFMALGDVSEPEALIIDDSVVEDCFQNIPHLLGEIDIIARLCDEMFLDSQKLLKIIGIQVETEEDEDLI